MLRAELSQGHALLQNTRKPPFVTAASSVRVKKSEWGPSIALIARGLFQDALLEFFLALNAMAGPRNRFQAFGVDFFSAGDAFTERSFADPSQ